MKSCPSTLCMSSIQFSTCIMNLKTLLIFTTPCCYPSLSKQFTVFPRYLFKMLTDSSSKNIDFIILIILEKNENLNTITLNNTVYITDYHLNIYRGNKTNEHDLSSWINTFWQFLCCLGVQGILKRIIAVSYKILGSK